jgi:hypothetical protein
MIISGTTASSSVSLLGLPNVFPGEDAGYGFPCELGIPTSIDIRLQRTICRFADLEDSLYSDDFGDNHGFMKPGSELSQVQQALAALMNDDAFDRAVTTDLIATFQALFAEHCNSYKEWKSSKVEEVYA